MAVEVSLIFTPLVDQVWPKVKDGMRASCERSGNQLTAGWLWQECRSGRAILLAAHDGDDVFGAAVVQFQDNGRMLRGLGFCGTRVDEWHPAMRALIREIMIDGGAERFIDEGPPGMKKFYPDAKVLGMTFEVRPS